MANPVIAACTINTWTKVATNVVTGQVHRLTNSPQEYLSTYRLTGDAAPTTKEEGVPIFKNGGLTEQIQSNVGIDVYIYALGSTGKVRVDL